MRVEETLLDLFKVGAVAGFYTSSIEYSDGNLTVPVSQGMDAVPTIVTVYQALEKVGLIDNGKRVSTGFNLTVNDEVTCLGYLDKATRKFCDQVTLSDNATALANPEKGFSFRINFGNRTEDDIIERLSRAIQEIKNHKKPAVKDSLAAPAFD